MSKQIIIVKPKTLSPKDKEKLTKNGNIVIEHPFPSEVRIMNQINEIDPHTLLMSALKGANDGFSSREIFVQELYKRLFEKETKTSSK